MTASEQATFRTVFVTTTGAAAEGSSAEMLLSQLGHEVVPAESTDEAIRLLAGDHADLVVMDGEGADQQDFVDRLGRLPTDHQPRVVALFSEEGSAVREFSAQGVSSRIQVLLKPLHVHGLLGVLKSLERGIDPSVRD